MNGEMIKRSGEHNHAGDAAKVEAAKVVNHFADEILTTYIHLTYDLHIRKHEMYSCVATNCAGDELCATTVLELLNVPFGSHIVFPRAVKPFEQPQIPDLHTA